ncbi:MAG: hypothetical protein ACP5OU_01450 [Methanothrix sp.]
MVKSFWMIDQKGNFSDGGKDTFDESKDYIGIRLQQGVPLLDRDWNELEDIRRHQEWVLRAKYLGDGTPDNGFAISLISGKVDDFNISNGRCLVDGFEAVNRADTTYLNQGSVAPLTIPTGKRTDSVYIDLWISEIHGTPDLKNGQDVKIETCARHKIEWKVRVNEASKKLVPLLFHNYYIIASIERDGATITSLKDLRTALRINPLFKAISVGNNGNIGIGSDNPRGPLSIRAAFANQELMNFEDPTGKMMWYINQNIGGNSPGLNIAEAGASDGRLFLKAGGYVGINNMNPQRSLHIEGSEVHSGGTLAGFSFANRDAPNKGAFVDSAADGQRWVWYAAGQAAHLWAGDDKLVVDKEGNLSPSGGITFGNASRRIYGDVRANSQSVVLKGNWDELEVKGRVIDWTGDNLHIGYQNDHSKHFVYIGAPNDNARVKGVEINHGPQTGAKSGDNVGLKLLSKDNGGLIYGYDVNHSILFRVGQDGVAGVTDFHGSLGLRFYTGGNLENQIERMRIDAGGAVRIGSGTQFRGKDLSRVMTFGTNIDSPNNDGSDYLVIHKASGYFKRNTLAMHVHKDDAFGVYSTNWMPLLEVEGGSGNLYVKGGISAGRDLVIEKIAGGAKKTLPNGATMIWNDGEWLRLGQSMDYTTLSKVHTPGFFSSGSLNVGGVENWKDPGGGNIIFSGTLNGKRQDIAENYVSDSKLDPGDVVCVQADENKIALSQAPNDPKVIGVVSTNPGVLLNSDMDLEGTDQSLNPIALSGRVPCKVTDEGGPIKRGDLLASSSTPGHAMKAKPVRVGDQEIFRQGTIIGKALEPLESGKGLIDIFVFMM